MKIEGKSFQVIGIIKRIGTGFLGALDSAVFMPAESARETMKHFQGNDKITRIYVRAAPGENINRLAEEITASLAEERGVPADEPDFTVRTPEKMSQQVGLITGALALFLGGVAAISLVVGGIGIANTLFMSVMERTREIGILKAVGASNWSILEIFLFEAGIIGMAGGFIGVGVGLLACLVLNAFGVPSKVSFELVVFAVGFSFFVGLVSGYFPAARAARLKPAEALRYE